MAFPDTVTLDTADVDAGTARELHTIKYLADTLSALLGALNVAKNTDPAASASLNATLKGILENTGNGVVLTANMTSGFNASAMTGTTAADVIAAPGASVGLRITTVIVSNADTDTDTEVELRDGTTVLAVVPAAKNCGGATIQFPVPLVCTANTAFTARPKTTGASITVSAVGYEEAA
jgi:hypothetical protein